jgi:hypothetical protein
MLCSTCNEREARPAAIGVPLCAECSWIAESQRMFLVEHRDPSLVPETRPAGSTVH